MIKEGTEREGRRVVYSPRPGVSEPGTVVSWNDQYVFVRFDGDTGAKGCYRRNLYWESEE